MTVRKLQQKRGWAFNFAVPIVKPTMLAATSRTWIDGEKIPATGGCIVVFNHISHIDPLMAAHFVYDHGRLPRYLAKSGLFKNRFLGRFLRDAGQIPVERLSRNAVGRVRRRRRGRAPGRVRRRLPRGHAHPRPRPVADGRQVRRGPDRARDRLPGHPGRPVGRPRAAAAVHQAAAAGAAQARRDEGRRPGRPGRPDRDRRAAPHAQIINAGDRPDHGRDRRARRGAARRAGAGRAVRPAPGRRAQIGNPRKQRSDDGKGTSDEQGRGVRGRLVGHGVLDRAGRRRQRGDDVGSARGGLRRHHRAATRTPTTCPTSSCPPTITATHDPAQARRRRRGGRLRRPVAVVPRQPRRVGARCCPTTCRSSR